MLKSIIISSFLLRLQGNIVLLFQIAQQILLLKYQVLA